MSDLKIKVGSPRVSTAAKQEERRTAKGTNTVSGNKANSAPVRVLTEAQYQMLLRDPDIDDAHRVVFETWIRSGRLVIVDRHAGRATA